MTRREVTTTEACERFRELLESVREGESFRIVDNEGELVAVLATPEQYQAIEERTRRAWEAVERIRKRSPDQDPDEVHRIVTEEVEAAKQELYKQRQANGAHRY